MHQNSPKQISQNNKTPWVVFYSVSWKPFYVDVLHALNLGTQEKLNEILAIESIEEFEYEINKLCLSPLMRKTYTIYGLLLKKSNKKSSEKHLISYIKDKLLYCYYYILSPKLVPLQLKYPWFNKRLYTIVDKSADILLIILNKKVLSEEEIFEVKKIWAKRKMTHATDDVKRDYADYWTDGSKTSKFLGRYKQDT